MFRQIMDHRQIMIIMIPVVPVRMCGSCQPWRKTKRTNVHDSNETTGAYVPSAGTLDTRDIDLHLPYLNNEPQPFQSMGTLKTSELVEADNHYHATLKKRLSPIFNDTDSLDETPTIPSGFY
eukprot:UN31509